MLLLLPYMCGFHCWARGARGRLPGHLDVCLGLGGRPTQPSRPLPQTWLVAPLPLHPPAQCRGAGRPPEPLTTSNFMSPHPHASPSVPPSPCPSPHKDGYVLGACGFFWALGDLSLGFQRTLGKGFGGKVWKINKPVPSSASLECHK